MAAAKKKTQKFSRSLQVILLILALIFAFALFWLSSILLEYHKGDAEYNDILSHMEEIEVTLPAVDDSNIIEETDEAMAETEPGSLEQGAENITDDSGSSTPTRISLTVPDFDYLRSINSDVIGWVQIPGTPINYPIVQGSDNEYYLTHTFYGEENSSGAIYLDANIEDGLDDKNPIIYGHNLKSGKMFSRLNRYTRQSFWDTNRYVYITTEEGIRVYEVFSAYIAPPDMGVWQYGFGEDENFQAYIDRVMSYSVFDAGISVTAEDDIITLSTCANHVENRFVVHAKRI